MTSAIIAPDLSDASRPGFAPLAPLVLKPDGDTMVVPLGMAVDLCVAGTGGRITRGTDIEILDALLEKVRGEPLTAYERKKRRNREYYRRNREIITQRRAERRRMEL